MQELTEFKNNIEAELDALDEHRKSVTFMIASRDEQVLLNRQSVVMHGLLEILNERIILLSKQT